MQNVRREGERKEMIIIIIIDTESKGVNAGLVLHIMSICILTTFLIEVHY